MELYKYSDRIYYSAYEEERDRPAIGYIRGDKFSVAVDAGHSEDHLNEFYEALKKEGLPLPQFTVITHWHWDHSFAMHCINGFSVANRKTNEYLKDFIAARSEENDRMFLKSDPSVEKEYAGGKEIIVVPADIVFEGSLNIDCGGVTVVAFEAVSPHTSDATLIHIPEEKVLFIGDSTSGEWPTWIADPVPLRQLMDVIEGIDAAHIIGGHWPIDSKEELLNRLSEEL
ncbi:MAG: MBL fold metallo-hydrolase [Erysipelotrichaceae bacterium]|nr:MBL fold metallo-hydrolase [Erysipelotrichaceae bacterium]